MANVIIISILILLLFKLKPARTECFINCKPLNHTNSLMSKKRRKNYETPVTQVIEVKMQGVLAASGDPLDPLSDPLFIIPFGGGEDW